MGTTILIAVLAFFVGAAIEDVLHKDAEKMEANKKGRLVLLNSATGKTRLFYTIRRKIHVAGTDPLDIYEVENLDGEDALEKEDDDNTSTDQGREYDAFIS